MTLRFVSILALCACAVSASIGCAAESIDQVSFNTASKHSKQYYLSLPKGWATDKRWPVVIVIESANRQFEATLERFRKARQDMPFIVAAPLVVTNGGTGYRQVSTYRYSDSVWTEIERAGRCKFDFDGIAAVASDIHEQHGGEAKYFLTGWEAAGHTIWAFLFQHPENLRAVAPTCANYAGRCMDDGNFSSASMRAGLPVRIFGAEGDAGWRSGQPLFEQSQVAKQTAEAHGFRNVSEMRVPGKSHEPLAEDVLAYFLSEWKHSR